MARNKSSLFVYLLALTGFFLLLEISLFIQTSDVYFNDFRHVANRIQIPLKIIPPVLYFIFSQLLLHLSFTVLIWGLARLSGIATESSERTVEKLGIYYWIGGILLVLLANQYFYPNSKFSELLSTLIPHLLGKLGLIALLILFSGVFLLSLKGLYLITSKKIRILFLALLVIPVGLAAKQFQHSPIQNGGTAEKPNIIIIGIDALRPDFLGFFGYEKITPNIDAFLNKSTVYADAFTPIARTFPAWTSILTGQYPKKSGVRFNLPSLENFAWNNTLPAILRSHGYETVFATDEVRFSNIDQRFGFDRVITPPVGVNDFLLGNLNDFPLSNLIINTRLGSYLFPYSAGNRPVATTYSPDYFLQLLKPNLQQSHPKPLFLAIHFCLTHYPYTWGEHLADDKTVHNYQAAVARVDKQFRDFLHLLQQSQLLENSIVILLSDHGEGLELTGDRITEKELFIPGSKNKRKIIPIFYPKSFDFEAVNQSAGHGTDILGMTQYHVVLAMREFGINKIKAPRIVTGKVSLLDIKPTLLGYLKIPADNLDGKNLLLPNKESKKHFFMETDFSPNALRSVHPETRQLLFEGIEYYEIDPQTARIHVKKNMEHLIISSKQFADIYDDWILALYPQNKSVMIPILVNLQTGEWTNDLSTPFAKSSPADAMLKEMKQFYGKEITNIQADL